MNDTDVKVQLHRALRKVRDQVLLKVEGLSEYDVRRPLTPTGTNLLGLVKHMATWESRYFGVVFDRPFPEPIPAWNDRAFRGTDTWVTELESTHAVISRYRRTWEHTDATIEALDLDSPGHVPWWTPPGVTLLKVIIHVLTEAERHAGHADILREQVDGRAGMQLEFGQTPEDQARWASRVATIEQAARAAQG